MSNRRRPDVLRYLGYYHWMNDCPPTSNVSRGSVGNKMVNHSDVNGASPVGAAPTTSSFPTWHLVSMDWVKTTARRDEKHWSFVIWCVLYQKFDGNVHNKSKGFLLMWQKCDHLWPLQMPFTIAWQHLQPQRQHGNSNNSLARKTTVLWL